MTPSPVLINIVYPTVAGILVAVVVGLWNRLANSASPPASTELPAKRKSRHRSGWKLGPWTFERWYERHDEST